MYIKKILAGIWYEIYNNNNINTLKETTSIEYLNLDSNKINIRFSIDDVKNFKLQSQHYFKLIFLDQYGIQHINKINEFLGKGKDILIFIASGHCEEVFRGGWFLAIF